MRLELPRDAVEHVARHFFAEPGGPDHDKLILLDSERGGPR
ncbi:hypothetical protein [Streptomyces sp. NPDC017964]